MAQTTVAADFAQTLDVHSGLAAQVTFDQVVMLDCITQLSFLLFSQVLNTDVRVNASDFQNLGSTSRADAVDISQRNFNTLLAGKIDTRNTCHILSAPPINLVSACAWGFRKLP